MTKKDYIKFAAMLKETKQLCSEAYSGYELITAQEVLAVMEEKMIVIFKQDNPLFDSDKFSDAAEIE